MLRLVDRRPSPGERVVALGESMLDREQRGGVLMTIDVFPVRAVAEQDGHCCLDAAWPGDRTRDRAPPAGQRRASTGRSDAGAVVARGAPGPQAGSLGIFIARSGEHARNAAPAHPYRRLARLRAAFHIASARQAPPSRRVSCRLSVAGPLHRSHPLHPLHPIGLYSRL